MGRAEPFKGFRVRWERKNTLFDRIDEEKCTFVSDWRETTHIFIGWARKNALLVDAADANLAPVAIVWDGLIHVRDEQSYARGLYGMGAGKWTFDGCSRRKSCTSSVFQAPLGSLLLSHVCDERAIMCDADYCVR